MSSNYWALSICIESLGRQNICKSYNTRQQLHKIILSAYYCASSWCATHWCRYVRIPWQRIPVPEIVISHIRSLFSLHCNTGSISSIATATRSMSKQPDTAPLLSTSYLPTKRWKNELKWKNDLDSPKRCSKRHHLRTNIQVLFQWESNGNSYFPSHIRSNKFKGFQRIFR